eukprot:CAMPEP_0174883730 /NCGR_PEP_ID=MMETSP1114-20130205/85412_1 /TAXON_ID=312471 /ORGANISM="Neobodo designis, Strain CCAP 1951/1" /LENGTH=266 /DNA_ID=CAMNT_0016119133 /DNA_START=45 /DNA_END=842 /DNA_ORIENTATION=-
MAASSTAQPAGTLPPITPARHSSPQRRHTPPAAPVGNGHGQVIHALNPHLRANRAHRTRRLRTARPDVVERAVAQQTAHEEAVRKRLARDYDDRVTSRFMLDLTGDPADSSGGRALTRPPRVPVPARAGPSDADGGDHQHNGGGGFNSARRPRAANILKETETQTLVSGGDSRTARRQHVSLGSKRLNTLATVVANNPLLQSMSNTAASRTGIVAAKAPVRESQGPISPQHPAGAHGHAGVVKGSVSAQTRPTVAPMKDVEALHDP